MHLLMRQIGQAARVRTRLLLGLLAGEHGFLHAVVRFEESGAGGLGGAAQGLGEVGLGLQLGILGSAGGLLEVLGLSALLLGVGGAELALLARAGGRGRSL